MTRHSRLLAVVPLLALAGCRHAPLLGSDVLPPGVETRTGPFVDVNPRFSHDGRQIAFMRSTPDRKLSLNIVDADLTRIEPVTGPESVSPDRPYASTLERYCSPETVSWSPDDSKIAFERLEMFRLRDGTTVPGTSIWAFDSSNGEVTPLATHSSSDSGVNYYYRFASWSPDQRYLTYVGESINGQRALYMRSLVTSKSTDELPKFDNFGDSDWPEWAPRAGDSDADGDMLIYRQGIRRSYWIAPTETLRVMRPGAKREVARGELWRMTSAAFAATLGSRQPGAAPVVVRAGHIAWSPDAGRLAFTLTPDAEDFQRYQIWAVDRGSREGRRVSPDDGNGYFAPIWIGRTRIGALSPRGNGFAVVVIDVTNSSVKIAGTIRTADCDWSPDRSTVVYSARGRTGDEMGGPTTLQLLRTGVKAPVVALRSSGRRERRG